MDKIRIIQPYRLWRRLFSALGSKKYYILGCFGLALLIIFKNLYNSSGLLPFLFFGIFILLFFLFTIYNPFCRYYKPRPRLHSFDWKRFSNSFYDYYCVCVVILGYILGLFAWYFEYPSPFSDENWV